MGTSTAAWCPLGTILAGFGTQVFGVQTTVAAMAAGLLLLALTVSRLAPDALALDQKAMRWHMRCNPRLVRRPQYPNSYRGGRSKRSLASPERSH